MKLPVRKNSNAESGQTLIAIFLIMLVALSIGVTVSTRFIKSTKSVVGSDNANRALGVAEAAMERILLLPRSTVEDYTLNGTCGSDCSLTIYDNNNQEITATVTLSFMGDSSDTYDFPLSEGEADEITLLGYPSSADLELCWDTDASIYAGYVAEDGNDTILDPYAYSTPVTPYGADNFDTGVEMHGYPSCFTVLTRDTPQLLRVRALHEDTHVYIVPSPGSDLPIQGILVTSTGEFKGARREVTVLLTNPYVPTLFDYTLYQSTQDSPLSNSDL